MKKIAIALVAFALPFALIAQEASKEKIEKEENTERKEKAERPEKKETQEIIIRKNGDSKDINLKVEIKGDDITVNGKPLSEFKDKDITINKRKITISDGTKIIGNFDISGDGFDKLGETFGEDFMKNWGGGDNEGKGAFLGVTTEKVAGGVNITEVVKGSAAEKAGLKKGDVITKVGDEKITDPESLSDVIGFKKPKEDVKVTYKRNGKENTVKTTLGNRKGSRSRTFSFNAPGGNMRSFTMPPIPPMPPLPNTNMEGLNEDMLELQENALASAFPSRKKIGLKIQDIEEGGGVKIINVEDSSAAEIAGIKKDDIITEINGKKIDNTDDAREELVPDEDKKLYKIKINRAGSEMNFDVKIPRKLKTANL
jgi:serine protease Do